MAGRNPFFLFHKRGCVIINELAGILNSIKRQVNEGTVLELEKAQEPLSYARMKRTELEKEFAAFTQAIIRTINDDSFMPLKIYLSRLCKTRLEQSIKLSDIMAVFDLYEKSLKDAMSLHLQEDLPSLNRFRREIDALLDRARVYVSECFFLLYENTVFRQFEQLRIINEVSARLTSSLNITEVLNFIATNAARLFKANCGSISLVGIDGKFSTGVSHGWREDESPRLIAVNSSLDMPEITIVSASDVQGGYWEGVFLKEGLSKLVAIKLHYKDRVFGLLILGIRGERKFAESDKQVLITFANHAAIAVNNAQLYGDTDQQLQARVREVTILLEQNRAILQSMREGVVAIDQDGCITTANSEAIRLLGLTINPIGHNINKIIPNSRLPSVVDSRKAEYDQEQLIGGGKAVITNRVPVIVNDKVIGAIATFRDKQDVQQLAEELTGVKLLLDSTRAQSHEFINKLHAISGLIQMGQYDKVVELITQIYKSKQDLVSFIVSRIKDKATAGLLLGKVSQAQEKGVTLRIAPRSRLFSLPSRFGSAAMVTVLGNLVTNAIEAAATMTMERKFVEVRIFQGKKFLTITVDDLGPGIPTDRRKKIFQRGFTTKQGGRGIGLALVRQEVEFNGGRIHISSKEDAGTSFTVKIPMMASV
ncbi:MAG: ATP-binding protein [Negativicutes bacterium]|nr:ATP-binding protein [Negativicutes bacterium]